MTQKVSGIGGFFFRARQPKQLSQWYLEYLGVSPIPESDDQSPWHQEAGTTAFAPFPEDTDYFGNRSQAWMINFRVSDLDAMVAQLQNAGVAVEVDPEPYPHGRFARLQDPEGNPIELWQPAGDAA